MSRRPFPTDAEIQERMAACETWMNREHGFLKTLSVGGEAVFFGVDPDPGTNRPVVGRVIHVLATGSVPDYHFTHFLLQVDTPAGPYYALRHGFLGLRDPATLNDEDEDRETLSPDRVAMKLLAQTTPPDALSLSKRQQRRRGQPIAAFAAVPMELTRIAQPEVGQPVAILGLAPGKPTEGKLHHILPAGTVPGVDEPLYLVELSSHIDSDLTVRTAAGLFEVQGVSAG